MGRKADRNASDGLDGLHLDCLADNLALARLCPPGPLSAHLEAVAASADQTARDKHEEEEPTSAVVVLPEHNHNARSVKAAG